MSENCEICGEAMPEGEEMFKYHGYSGSCPKPPLSKSSEYAPLPETDPRMIAWKQYLETVSCQNAKKWALLLNYEDGRQISEENRSNHVLGALWDAFISGFDIGRDIGRGVGLTDAMRIIGDIAKQ